MGYYVTLETSTVSIPKSKEHEALAALHALNETHDHLKNGGSYGPKPSDRRKWFSWMPENLKELTTLKDFLECAGFEVDYNSPKDQYNIIGYDSKTGSEKLFMWALAPFVQKTNAEELAPAHMEWQGEDGSQWNWTFVEGKMVEEEGMITWENPRTVQF
jgi:hypothetical protein